MTTIDSRLGDANDTPRRFEGADQLRLIADSLPVLISYIDADERYLFTNAAHEQTVRVDRSAILGLHVDEVLGRMLSAPVYAVIKRHMASALAGRNVEYELEYRRRDGRMRWVNGVYTPHRDEVGNVLGFFSVVTDITERRRWESLHQSETVVLELLAKGKPLEEVLHALVRQIQEHGDGLTGSVLLVDESGECLRRGVAPDLPEGLNRAIDGLPIGPAVGSCGTAAFRGERVIVEDTGTDPLWADFRELATQYGLGACWSQPIIGSDGTVLGTFAMYYATPRRPSDADLKVIESAADLAGIAIERTRSEQALRHEQQLLQTLMDNAADAIYFKDRDSRFVRANRAQSRYLGLDTPEEAIGRSDESFFRPEAAASYRTDEEQVIRTGKPIIGKIENNGEDGEGLRWFSTTKVPYRETDGTIIGTIGISRDITELKHLEDALREATEAVEEQVRERTAELRVALARLHRESAQRRQAETVLRDAEDRYRLLNESVPYVAWEYAQGEDRFEFVGAHAQEMLGFTPEEWRQPGFWKRQLHPDDRDWVVEFSREHRGSGQDHEFEYRMMTRAGEPVWVKDLTAIVAARKGATPRTRGIFIDITPRKQAEEQAKENQARLARVSHLSTVVLMAASLSHELNQPLQAIMTFAETCNRELRSDTADPDLIRDDLSQIARNAQRAGDIMARLRNFARSEPPRPTHVDVNEIVRGVVDLLTPTAHQAGVKIEMDLRPDLPEVPLDILQFEQAIQNLAMNGIDAMTGPALDRRILTIETRAAGDDEIEIIVRDTGPGVPAASLAQAFEPFFSTKPKGMGLGLSLTRRIVNMHGGRIDVTNAPGGGATFVVNVPRCRPEMAIDP